MTTFQYLGLRLGLLLDRLPRRKKPKAPNYPIIITGNLVVNASEGTIDAAAVADAIRKAAEQSRGRA